MISREDLYYDEYFEHWELSSKEMDEFEKSIRADAIDECITETQRIGKSSTDIKTHNLLDYIIRHFEQLKEQK